MEKFRKFSDDNTGKHPFLSVGTPQPIFHFFIATLLLPIRLLCTLFFFISCFLSISIFGKYSKISSMIEKILTKLFLSVFGITLNLETRNNKLDEKCIYLSNQSSFLDRFIVKNMFFKKL